MTQVLLREDDAKLMARMVAAFAAVGYSVQDLDRALEVLGRAFAPPKTIVLSVGNGLRGLSADILMVGEFCEQEGNHPDGWYRKFYLDTAPRYNPNVNTRCFVGRTRYLPYRAKQTRQISRSFLLRVNNDNNTRLPARHG